MLRKVAERSGMHHSAFPPFPGPQVGLTGLGSWESKMHHGCVTTNRGWAESRNASVMLLRIKRLLGLVSIRICLNDI